MSQPTTNELSPMEPGEERKPGRPPRFTKANKKRFLMLLEMNGGNVKMALNTFRQPISEQVYRNARRRDPTWAARVDKAKERGRNERDDWVIDASWMIKDKLFKMAMECDLEITKPNELVNVHREISRQKDAVDRQAANVKQQNIQVNNYNIENLENLTNDELEVFMRLKAKLEVPEGQYEVIEDKSDDLD